MCRVTQVLTGQTLSLKKGVRDEFGTLSSGLGVIPLVSTRYVSPVLIDSLDCRGKINGVGAKHPIFHMTRYDNLMKLYFVKGQ